MVDCNANMYPKTSTGVFPVIPPTMGDATILTVVGTGRGNRHGHAAGGWLPGVKAGCSGSGPMEVAAGASVSLGLGSGLGGDGERSQTDGDRNDSTL